jgi:hypothetical protein
MGTILLLGGMLTLLAMSAGGKSSTTSPGSAKGMSQSAYKESLLKSPFPKVTSYKWRDFVSKFLKLFTLQKNYQPTTASLKEVGITNLQFQQSTISQIYAVRGLMVRYYKMIQTNTALMSIIGKTDKSVFPTEVTLSGLFAVIYSEGWETTLSIFLKAKTPKQRTVDMFKIFNGVF